MRFLPAAKTKISWGSPRDRYAVARPTISLHFDPDSGPGWVQSDGQALSPAQPRGATVAFDSLDGLPPGQFRKLVQNLNEEVQARRLAVISREQSSAYRVRGYLAVKVAKHQTTVSWVWDVFDHDVSMMLRHWRYC